LLSVELASPPIRVRFGDHLNDVARAEGQIIGFLKTLVSVELVKKEG
jgi:hypothetical protein